MGKLLIIAASILTLASCSHKSSKNEQMEQSNQEIQTPSGPSEAQAVLTAAKGKKIKGTVKFKEENGQVIVTADIDGLKPGPHGFHIHEVGACDQPDFTTAGGHFNPTQSSHGSESSENRHGGDMGNIIATAKGKAEATISITGVTVKEGPASIIGKSVVVHAGKDDLKSQPAGNSGAREACGIIEAI